MGPTWAKVPISDPYRSFLDIMPGFCPYGTHLSMLAGVSVTQSLGPLFQGRVSMYAKYDLNPSSLSQNNGRKPFLGLKQFKGHNSAETI